MKRDPAKLRAWQQRSRERAAERRRSAPLRRTGFGQRGRPLKRKPTPHIAAGFTLAAKGEDRCRVCGAPATALHHIVPRSRSRLGRDDLRNAIGLCSACHDAWHSGMPIYRELLSAEEFAFASTLIGPGWLGRRYPSRAWTLADERDAA